MTVGHYLAFIGAALAAIGGGIGSSIGVGSAGQAVAGLAAEAPDRMKKAFVLQLLPATQAIYGLLIAVLVLIKINAFGDIVALSEEQGMAFLMACLPIAAVGLVSAIYQGKAANSAIALLGKRPEVSGFGLVAAVETFAIFAMLVSALMVLLGVKV